MSVTTYKPGDDEYQSYPIPFADVIADLDIGADISVYASGYPVSLFVPVYAGESPDDADSFEMAARTPTLDEVREWLEFWEARR